MQQSCLKKNIFMSLLFLFITTFAFAQNRVISGKVTDAKDGSTLVGVSIIAKGTTNGAISDINGNYQLTTSQAATTLMFSLVGYDTREVTIIGDVVNVTLNQKASKLKEVVVIGYGTQAKEDLTGAVTSVSSKDFVKGPITTAEQLINGKVAGVQITSNGGAPGSGSRIRIRGGSSLNANNDPLIVIDGVPLDNSGISGSANPLNLINPNDIESFDILRDASATAIYGSRASNGVIIITTKKGKAGDKFQVNFSTQQSLQVRRGQVNVLNADEFRSLVTQYGNQNQQNLLGTENTNWQDQIYRNALMTDNNLSISGSAKNLPYRVSLGYLNQDGILKESNVQRTSATINLSPRLFEDHLKVDLNFKGARTNSNFSNQGAIGSAVSMDPTKPVSTDNTKFGGYWQWLDNSGNPNTLATKNPLGLIEQREDIGNATRAIMNAQFDYSFHFLPALRANLNVAYDLSRSDGTIVEDTTNASSFARRGVNNEYSQSKDNKTFDFYLNYVKDITKSQKLDLTAGYSYQDFLRENPAYPDLNYFGDTIKQAGIPFKTQNTLVSFFGRANYSINNRYLATFTLRQDGSSRFSPETRCGLFPSAAFAWKISQEGFMKNVTAVNNLKLRLGWGVTGQQDVFSDYPYLARYTISDPNAYYQFGDEYVATLRPEGYDANIKWEETTTSNIGLDFGIGKNGRLSGSVDLYYKETKDLLSVIPVPAGSNLTNQILTNVGNLENKGVELLLNYAVVQRSNFNWDLGFNATYNQNKITNLTKVSDPNFLGILVGGISGGVGNTVQIHSVDYPTNSFYVYKQVYDANGKPIEGLYEDTNGDGVISDRDKVHYQRPDPNWIIGITSQINYKKWNGGFVLRGNIGNYMYNNFSSTTGAYRSFTFPGYLSNVSSSVLETNFGGYQLWSDYYMENASFLRLDNFNVGYSFDNVFKSKATLRVSGIVQNAFVITKYSGLDPEIGGGIDNSLYPRPRIFSFGLNLGF